MAVRVSRFAAIALASLGLAGSVLAQQPPAKIVQAGGSIPEIPPQRVVAYIHGNVPITRDDLADFLITRGGHEKIDLLINRKIIEIECAKRKVTVTPQEMEAQLNEDMKGFEFSRNQFLEQLLPRYNKTYYEWMEDVIKPRLLLKKLCQDQVVVTEDDVKKRFENLYGEKRSVQMVMWPVDQMKVAQDQFAEARKSQEEFDRVARNQAQPGLAASLGYLQPISRHQIDKDPSIEKIAFDLKVGEVSHIQELKVQPAYVILKLHKIIPADTTVQYESKKEELKKVAFEKKVEELIPVYFTALKKAAMPTLPLIGPPKDWQLELPKKTKGQP